MSILKKMKSVLKRANNCLGKYLGVKLKNTNIQSINAKHPIEGEYLSKNLPFIMDLPLNKGRVMRWYPLTKNSSCPFIVASNEFLKKNSVDGIEKILEEFESTIEPHNANDTLGLDNALKVFPEGAPPREITLPWVNKNVNEIYQAWKRINLKENKQHSLNSSEYFGSGHATEKKIKVEATRIKKLIKSIQDNGYSLDTTDCISAIILVDENDWCFYVLGGNHRASILAALEYKSIPVLVKKIIRKKDVTYWPNVVNGLYSEDSAIQIFDRKFYAKPPPIFNRWGNITDQYKK